MSDSWAKAIAEIAALLKRWGAAIAAYFAGRAAGKQAAENKAERQDDKAREAQDEKDVEYNRRIRDARRRGRLRDALEKPADD